MAFPLPPRPNQPIPNNPFYYPGGDYLQGDFGLLIVGGGIFIDYATGTISAGGSGPGGINTILAGSGIYVSPNTGGVVTVSNTGALSLTAGNGIQVVNNAGNYTIINTAPASAPTGTVTSVTAGAGLLGGTFTSSGTISLPTTGVAPSTYTNPTITIDAYGRITAASPGGTGAGFPVQAVAPLRSDGLLPSTISIDNASTLAPGAVRLNDTVTSDSTTQAATARVLKQTYGIANTAAIDAASAVTASNVAVATSNNALSVANTAQTCALLALTNAAIAQGDANQAITDAAAAQSTANSALSTATSAQGVANSALSSASARIPCSAVTAKGALLTGTAPGAVTALTVGTDGQVLFACSTAPSGLCWGTIAGTPAATPTTLGTLFGCSNASNTSVGCSAFLSGGGALNAALGLFALSGGNTGVGNVAVGARSLQSNTIGVANVGLGIRALCKNTTGENNMGIGAWALCNNTIGNCNTAVGTCSMCLLDGGDNNVAIGFRAGDNLTTGCNNVAIGCNVRLATAAGNNQLAIGFSNLDNWLTGNATKAIQPGAGIIDCAGSCGTANMVLTSQGNAIQWKPVSSGIAAPNYGSFLNTGTQIIGTVNVPQAVTLNTTVSANGFTLNGGGSQIIAANAGTYNLQFSLQLVVTTGGGGNVEIWLAKNGNPVPNSNTRFAVKNVNEAEFAALNYVERLAAGDNLQLIWVTDDVHIQLFSYAAGANFVGAPAIPSAIVTIVPVGA